MEIDLSLGFQICTGFRSIYISNFANLNIKVLGINSDNQRYFTGLPFQYLGIFDYQGVDIELVGSLCFLLYLLFMVVGTFWTVDYLIT